MALPQANVRPIQTTTSRRLWGFVLIACGILLVATLSICLGSANFLPGEVLQALLGSEEVNAVHRQIIIDFRLPQVVTALMAGAATEVRARGAETRRRGGGARGGCGGRRVSHIEV